MGKSRPHSSREATAPEPPRQSMLAGPAFGVTVFLVVYSLIFFSTPIPEPGDPSRGERIAYTLLVPDFVVSNWLGDPPAFALLERLHVIALAALMLVPITLAGWLVLGILRAERGLTRLERIFFSACLGLGATSLYMLAIGLLGQLQNRGAVLAPAAIVCVAAAVRWWLLKDPDPEALIDYAPPAEDHAHASLADRRWMWVAAPFVAAIVLGGALPPTDFDVREYHLQAPKEFYENGKITFLPHNVYANMPAGSEMLSLAAMQTLGDWWLGALVGKTMIAGCALWAALGLLAAGRRWAGNRSGVVAALVFLSAPWIAQVSTAGLVEGVSAMFLWGAVYATLLWRNAPVGKRLPRVLLAGLLAGAAVACKYPNLVFIAFPLAAYVAYYSWTRDRAHLSATRGAQDATHAEPIWRRLMPAAAFVVAAAAVCGPWFLKNWALTGNPVYPLAYEIFGGESRTPELAERWSKAHDPEGFGPTWLLTSMIGVALQNTLASILIVPLAALGLLGTRHRRLALTLGALAGYYILTWWLFTHRLDRFWAPAIPIPAMLAGLAFTDSRWRSCRLILNWFLALGLAVNWIFIVAGGGGDNAYFARTSQLRTDPNRVDPWKVYLNEHIEPGDKVLSVGDAEVFDLEMPVYYNTVFDPNLFDEWFKGRSPKEIRGTLADHNVSYVYVSWEWIERYRSKGNYGYSNYIQPELLVDLIRREVLDKPIAGIDGSGELFPVHRAPQPAPK
jgi:4-amino-4-deoxy-L-arabinose transferase-like glycosyltransferase